MESIPNSLSMPWIGKDVPHGAIEVNQQCNLSCDGCYKNKFCFDKSVEDLKKEIDLMMSLRNLGSMTLTGGEPTLFKELPKLIKYISSKGIRPMVLTNGTNLTDNLLKTYKKNGLVRIGIHMDMHQNIRPDFNKKAESEVELNKLRKHYLDLCEENGLGTSLQATLYNDNLKDIFEIIELSQKRSSLHAGTFFTLYSPDINLNHEAKKRIKSLEPNISDIMKLMYSKEKAYPVMHVSSEKDEKLKKWIFYMNFVTKNRKGNISKLYFNPRYKGLLASLMSLQKKIRGRYSFDDPRSKTQNYLFLWLYSIYSFPRKDSFRATGFLLKSIFNGDIKTFTTLFQKGPTKLKNGEYDTCKGCPDATIRDGKLVPICLADFIQPLKR